MGLTPRENRQKKASDVWGQAGLAMSIPMLLLSGPLVGYGLGWAIRRWLGWGSWIEWTLLAIGLIAGVRETIIVIKKIS